MPGISPRAAKKLPLELFGKLCRLRAYRADEADALRAVADDFLVARWMTRNFPHPYTPADADEWIATVKNRPTEHFAIDLDGTLAGGIGINPLDGERGGTALFGYWLGRRFWGRGIATDAARTLSDHVLANGTLRRLEATVFAPNTASARVLEKSGFRLEARLAHYYLDREGCACDGLMYGRVC
jgi:[ribosomal protein S5]-alanine N-acetyltransferase